MKETKILAAILAARGFLVATGGAIESDECNRRNMLRLAIMCPNVSNAERVRISRSPFGALRARRKVKENPLSRTPARPIFALSLR